MQTTILGRTGLKVSRLGVGGGGPSQLGHGNSTGVPADDSTTIVRLAMDSGVNFIDTAEAYRTEAIIGEAIRGIPRDQLVLSTKKTTWGEQAITPADVRASLEASLKRLGTDYVDIYSLHGIGVEEYDYLASEIIPVFQQLQTEGKIRFIGITEAFHSDTQHIMLQRALQDDEGKDHPEGGATSIPDAAYRFCRDEPGTHVILSGTGSVEHMRANLESIERPPLPEAVTSRLKTIFRRVDSVSGQ